MKYIVIGLNNYGSVLAEELSALGHEVIGADINASRADCLKDKIAATFVIDATDEQALSVLPLNTVDVVIVSVGKNLGVSIRTVALLKQKKVSASMPVPSIRFIVPYSKLSDWNAFLLPKPMLPVRWFVCLSLEPIWRLSR